jgi:hypothetical protein
MQCCFVDVSCFPCLNWLEEQNYQPGEALLRYARGLAVFGSVEPLLLL